MFKYLFTFLILLAITSCTKKTSKKWLLAEVNVTNSITGAPVNAKIELEYSLTSKSLFGASSETVTTSLGITDEQGHLSVEREIPKKASNPRIYVVPLEHCYQPAYFLDDYRTNETPVNVRKKNALDLKITPFRPYELSIKNVNCSGVSDSLWMKVDDGSKFLLGTGCLDTTIHTSPHNYTGSTKSHQIAFTMIWKKAGLVDSTSQCFHLLTNCNVTPIYIQY